MATLQKISATLWFDNQAAEAAKYYTGIFKNAAITRISHYGKAGFETHKMPEGMVMTVEFNLENASFIALNGGPIFRFNESVSFVVNCESQEEIDYYWERLGAGGDEKDQVCGWLKDKFGLSWQIVPVILADMMTDENREKADRAMSAMLQMKKIDIATLKKAIGEPA